MATDSVLLFFVAESPHVFNVFEIKVSGMGFGIVVTSCDQGGDTIEF